MSLLEWFDDSQVGYIWVEEDQRMVMDDFGTCVVVPFSDWCTQNFEVV